MNELPPDLTPDEIKMIAAQKPVASTLATIVNQLIMGDIAAAWPKIHHTLRQSWVDQWIDRNRQALTSDGWNLNATGDALASSEPSSHELWVHFRRVVHREIGRYELIVGEFGISTAPRPIAPDVELLNLYPQSPGFHLPGEAHHVVPALMIRENGDWKLLTFDSEELPEAQLN